MEGSIAVVVGEIEAAHDGIRLECAWVDGCKCVFVLGPIDVEV